MTDEGKYDHKKHKEHVSLTRQTEAHPENPQETASRLLKEHSEHINNISFVNAPELDQVPQQSNADIMKIALEPQYADRLMLADYLRSPLIEDNFRTGDARRDWLGTLSLSDQRFYATNRIKQNNLSTVLRHLVLSLSVHRGIASVSYPPEITKRTKQILEEFFTTDVIKSSPVVSSILPDEVSFDEHLAAVKGKMSLYHTLGKEEKLKVVQLVDNIVLDALRFLLENPEKSA